MQRQTLKLSEIKQHLDGTAEELYEVKPRLIAQDAADIIHALELVREARKIVEQLKARRPN
jgi:hypothetical protein